MLVKKNYMQVTETTKKKTEDFIKKVYDTRLVGHQSVLKTLKGVKKNNMEKHKNRYKKILKIAQRVQ